MWMFNLGVLLSPSEPAAYKEFIFIIFFFGLKKAPKTNSYISGWKMPLLTLC